MAVNGAVLSSEPLFHDAQGVKRNQGVSAEDFIRRVETMASSANPVWPEAQKTATALSYLRGAAAKWADHVTMIGDPEDANFRTDWTVFRTKFLKTYAESTTVDSFTLEWDKMGQKPGEQGDLYVYRVVGELATFGKLIPTPAFTQSPETLALATRVRDARDRVAVRPQARTDAEHAPSL